VAKSLGIGDLAISKVFLAVKGIFDFALPIELR